MADIETIDLYGVLMFRWAKRNEERKTAEADATAIIELVKQVCKQIDPELDDDIFRGDNYLSGFVVGELGIALSQYWDRELSTKDKGRIANRAWEATGISSRWMTEHVALLVELQDRLFFKGVDDGTNVMLLRANKLPPNMHDADIEAALDQARSLHRMNTHINPSGRMSLNDAAAIVLQHLYLNRHLHGVEP